MSDSSDTDGSGDRPEEVEQTDSSLEELDEDIQDRFDDLRGDVSDLGRDIDDVGGSVDGLEDVVREEARETRETVEDEAGETRSEVRDEASDTRETVRDEASDTRGTVRDEASDTRDVVRDEHDDTRGVVEDEVDEAVEEITDRVDDAEGAILDELGDLMDRLDEHDGDVREFFEENQEYLEEIAGDLADLGDDLAAHDERLQEFIDGVHSDYIENLKTSWQPEQVERLQEAYERPMWKENVKDQYIATLLLAGATDGDLSEYAPLFQMFTAETGKGMKGVESEELRDIDLSDAVDARTVVNVVYDRGGDGYGALNDPLTGATLADEGGYAGVVNTVWNSIVQQTYDELLDAKHEDAVEDDVVETVEAYRNEGGEEVERTLSGSLGDTTSRGQMELLRFMDYTAQDVGRSLAEGQYEQAIEALEASYDPEGFEDIATGEIEVGA